MKSDMQSCDRQDYGGPTESVNEKRKHPEGGSARRSGSLSKSTASKATTEKKLKQDLESDSSDNNSQISLANSSSSSRTSSTKSDGYSGKSDETSRKGRVPSKCPYCPIIMSRSHDLRKHVERLHQGPQEILCHMCVFRATDIFLYLAHENDHLCKCPYCGFVAKNYRGLPRHKTYCRLNPNFQGETIYPQGDKRRKG